VICPHGRAGEGRAQPAAPPTGEGPLAGGRADRGGVHQSYLSGVERSRRNPTVAVLQRIAEALDVYRRFQDRREIPDRGQYLAQVRLYARAVRGGDQTAGKGIIIEV
jgi:hypothetical protein